jgi:hypothetical protein
LDQKLFCEALAHLQAVDSGMLQLAAKVLLRQVGMRAHEGGGGESMPRM